MNEKFLDQECIVCKEKFNEADDIVVCPDCGTPYHRDCWNIEKRCVNDELHASGGVWTKSEKGGTADPQTENDLRCIRCGKENQPGQMFCSECGMPLNSNRNSERPFNNYGNSNGFNQNQGAARTGFNNSQNDGFFSSNQNGFNQQGTDGFNFGGAGVQMVKLTKDSDINGIKLGDFFEYAGHKSMMIANFVKFAKSNVRISINIGALFFPEYYFFYRKMNKTGALFLALSFLLMIPNLIYAGQSGAYGMVFFTMPFNLDSNAFVIIYNICSVISTVINVLAGVYANYWYYKRAREDILKIRSDCVDQQLPESEAVMRIQKTGGTSWATVICVIVGELVLSLGLMLLLAVIF